MNKPPALPYSEDGERGLVCSMILDPEALTNCAQLQNAIFYLLSTRIVFDALVHFHRSGLPIDFVPIKNYLNDNNQLEDVGGVDGLSELWSFVSSGANWSFYLDLVTDRHQRRVTILACQKIMASMHDVLEERTTAIQDEAERALSQMAIQAMAPEKSFREQVHETLEELETLSETVQQKGAIFGIHSLDDHILGMLPAELWVLAAETSQGKSALAMQAALRSSFKRGLYVVIFALEMMATEIIKRMLSNEGEISMRYMREGRFPDHKRLIHSAEKLMEARLHIYDDFQLDWNSIVSLCRQKQTALARTGDSIGLIVMDYIQLIEGDGDEERKELEISNIVRKSKGISKEMRCPVLGVSQLTDAKKLYGARAIKYHADGLLIMEESDSDEEGSLDICVAKMRNGERNKTVPIIFEGQYMTFKDNHQ